LDVKDIKDFSIAQDTRLASFTLVTKYAGDLGIRIPVQGLKALRDPSAPEDPKPPPAEPAALPATKPGQLTLALAAKWLIAVDKKHRVAVVVSNPGAPAQTGFALKPKDARELAAALIKRADALETASVAPQA
jgi:hypothetical protein